MISVSESDEVKFYLNASKASVGEAISALNSANLIFLTSGNAAGSLRCTDAAKRLASCKVRLNDAASSFEETTQTLKQVDRSYDPFYVRAAIWGRDAIKGSLDGMFSSVVGHSAASVSLNAWRSALYRKKAAQLHGFAFEVMYADKLNMGLNHKLFTKAVVDGSNKTGSDVLLKKGEKVLEVFELKATKLKEYAKKAIDKLNGAYKGKTLVFTDEMAKETGQKAGGISYGETREVANAALSNSKEVLKKSAVVKSAAASGAVSAVLSGGIEAVANLGLLLNQEITGKEYLNTVGKETLIGGMTGAITGAALTGLTVAGVALTGGTAMAFGIGIGCATNWGLHWVFSIVEPNKG